MRESIGSVFLYNIIIIFIIIVIGLLAATTSYYKAFKVNNRILSSIEKFEGYNKPAKDEIDNFLSSIGYSTMSGVCPGRDGLKSISDTSGHLYCVYYHADDRGKNEGSSVNGDKEPIYYNYSVVTYIFVELPIVGSFKVPVYTKGERTYNFTGNRVKY